jgi:uncharacterized protein (DUF362 family)
MDRRRFLRDASYATGMMLAPSPFRHVAAASNPSTTAYVAFVKTMDRADGVRRALDLLNVKSFQGKDLFLKPNFNSADAAPGSTHQDTLVALIRELKARGAGPLTIGDRSGMGKTREVMESKQIFKMATDLGAKIVVFDELHADDWELIKPSDSHWQQGFALPRLVRNAGAMVQTCCLKTHRYGGHFTLSLKNSVGLAAKFVPGQPYNYMQELHSSPHQRRMIAEINSAYRPDLVVLDGVEAFANGGPDTGKLVHANVVLAGTDRVAIDAVGVALLRYFGTTPEVSRGTIFEQEQLARAAELRLGITRPEHIELVTGDHDSAEYVKQIRPILDGETRPN